ncbi:hypothetical protein J4G37_38105, partial [Microvirga sp. 3-52]|nr:hypothetical protein [Microvirga sp. 3-52]
MSLETLDGAQRRNIKAALISAKPQKYGKANTSLFTWLKPRPPESVRRNGKQQFICSKMARSYNGTKFV